MCWYCGSPITSPEPLGRSQICSDCGKDLRSCSNCRHFIPQGKGCNESQGENPSDKERANFCDWFNLNPAFRQASKGKKNAQDAAGAAREAFNKMFE